MALTLAGMRPGVSLPGGRRIPIHVDVAALLGMNGMVEPFLTGNTGTLDPSGGATAGLMGDYHPRCWYHGSASVRNT